MNEKMAKRLRRVAREIAGQAAQHNGGQALPYAAYEENEKNRPVYTVQKRDDKGLLLNNEDGTPALMQIPYAVGTISLAENCVRGIYRSLKRNFASGALVSV